MGIAAGGCLDQDRWVGPSPPVAYEGCETLASLTRACDLGIAAASTGSWYLAGPRSQGHLTWPSPTLHTC
eukprot:1373964-Karenia_brevis.AAC.1